MKIIFNVIFAVISLTLLISTTAATMAYASNHRSGSDSKSSSSTSNSPSTPSSTTSTTPSTPSTSGGTPSSNPTTGGTTPSTPSTPTLPTTPPPVVTPPVTPPTTKVCPAGFTKQPNGTCINSSIIVTCPDGSKPNSMDKCPSHLPHDCKKIDNSTVILCKGDTHTIVHNTIQQAPLSNNINLFIVTSCTTAVNDNMLKGDLATLCDTSITMMHNEGLNSQLPQVDLYLKGRGLLA